MEAIVRGVRHSKSSMTGFCAFDATHLAAIVGRSPVVFALQVIPVCGTWRHNNLTYIRGWLLAERKQRWLPYSGGFSVCGQLGPGSSPHG
jgi:hypothetical protein